MKTATTTFAEKLLILLDSLLILPQAIHYLILDYHGLTVVERLLFDIDKLLEKYSKEPFPTLGSHDITFLVLLPALNHLREALYTLPHADIKLTGETVKKLENCLMGIWQEIPTTPPFLEKVRERRLCYNLLDQVAMFLVYFRTTNNNHQDQNINVALQIKNLMLKSARLCSLQPYTINIVLVELMKNQLTDMECKYWKGEEKQSYSSDSGIRRCEKALDEKRVLNGRGDHLQGVCFKWFNTCSKLERAPRTTCTDLLSLSEEKQYQLLLDKEQAEQLKKLCQQAGDITPKPSIVEDTSYSFGA